VFQRIKKGDFAKTILFAAQTKAVTILTCPLSKEKKILGGLRKLNPCPTIFVQSKPKHCGVGE